jgi:hypothetical protein
MTGDIRTFEFDDRNSRFFSKKATTDDSVRRISRFLYQIHDDLIDHPISVTAEGWAALRRIVAFLGTDFEIGAAQQRPAWPFHSHEERLRNERLLHGVDLPQYDPAIHGRAANPWYNRIPSRVGFMVLGGLLLAVLIALFFLT